LHRYIEPFLDQIREVVTNHQLKREARVALEQLSHPRHQ
jgi:uncharacterized protein YjiS (DUF1127 family)